MLRRLRKPAVVLAVSAAALLGLAGAASASPASTGGGAMCIGSECTWMGSSYLETKTSGDFTKITPVLYSGQDYYLKISSGCLTWNATYTHIDSIACAGKASQKWYWAYATGDYVFWNVYLGADHCMTMQGNGLRVLMSSCPDDDPNADQIWSWPTVT